MTVRMRHTKGHRNNRRSQQGLEAPILSRCAHCGEGKLGHTICQNCGWYNGRQVLDVLAKLDKKERKKKEKELDEAKEREAGEAPLDAAQLSKK